MPIPASGPGPLATADDLAAMWRPLDSTEVDRANSLLLRASALLRQVMPHVDSRLALYGSSDAMALDPVLVATVVATIVKRFISNVEGIASQSVGPFSVSYALRSEKSVRGELQVTADDVRALQPIRPQNRVGTIRVHAAMAPGLVGRFSANSAILATGLYDSAWETERFPAFHAGGGLL